MLGCAARFLTLGKVPLLPEEICHRYIPSIELIWKQSDAAFIAHQLFTTVLTLPISQHTNYKESLMTALAGNLQLSSNESVLVRDQCTCWDTAVLQRVQSNEMFQESWKNSSLKLYSFDLASVNIC